jgi:hypothetical protein
MAVGLGLPLALDIVYFVGDVHAASPWSWRWLVGLAALGVTLRRIPDTRARWGDFGSGLILGALASVPVWLTIGFLTSF